MQNKKNYPNIFDSDKKLVLDFLVRWIAWAETSPLTKEFRNDEGLCNNYDRTGLGKTDTLMGMFTEDGLDEVFPFGHWEYEMDEDCETMHLCEKRLEWAKEAIDKLREDLL